MTPEIDLWVFAVYVFVGGLMAPQVSGATFILHKPKESRRHER